MITFEEECLFTRFHLSDLVREFRDRLGDDVKSHGFLPVFWVGFIEERLNPLIPPHRHFIVTNSEKDRAAN